MAKRGQALIYETLERMNIPYDMFEHRPAFTLEEMQAIGLSDDILIAKNLFLRDAKGRRHFLLMTRPDRAVDLKALQGEIGSSRLSFASAERMTRHLAVTAGSVAPVSILNDASRSVQVVFDRGFLGERRVGIHPNDNSVTLVLAFADIARVVEDHGNPITYVF